MKKTISYSLILLSFLAACTKEDTPIIKGDFFLKAYKNSTDLWLTNEPYASIVKTDKIIWIGGYKQNKNNPRLDESLIMQLSVANLSDLKNTTIKSVDYNTILEEDIITDRYVVDTLNINNKIEITDIDETNKVMKGRFTLYLIRDKWFSTNGEKTELKMGEFITSYTE